MIKIEKPTIVQAAGNKPKIIEEYIGRLNSGTDELSIARMKSPTGWIEPGQKPEFNEYTIVLKGMLRVATMGSSIFAFLMRFGYAIFTHRNTIDRIRSVVPKS